MENKFKDIVCNDIDKRSKDLYKISQEIWKKPELSSEEYFAHDLLTQFLEDEGFNVQKKYPLKTSFVAKYGSTNNDSIKIGIICEYDALPIIGHACGHNLIAEVGIAAAISLKTLLENNKDIINICIIVFGTPAEEGHGGKIDMIENGVFDEADLCMMSHPFPDDIAAPRWLSAEGLKITFNGKSSHAAAAPWEGINALDAAVSCYNNISMLRQQTKPTDRINVIISHGGDKPNIIPEKAELEIIVRGCTDNDEMELKEKISKCAYGAALSSGCTYEIVASSKMYSTVDTNKKLINLYINNAKTLGITFDDSSSDGAASTDMGNVSKIKPSIHPLFKIKTCGPNHTKEFTEASGSIENQIYALNSAKSIAMTAVDIICNPELLKDIQKSFLGS